ncbi:MAG: M20/M25/M40 family metallo-hydrolase [Clostridia bacterium]|nr:M20/M25/M40 family metallo-hydrolase [Clostridia bacterium]
MDYIAKLKELSGFPAVSGNEKMLSGRLKEMFEEKCDSVKIDKFFNVIGLKKGSGKKKMQIMISAHMDEIGFLVKSIDERGFIKFSNVGGFDNKILLAQEVIIHGKKDVPGVIGAKPPHLIKPEEAKKAVKLEELSIDTGLSKEALSKIISIGDVISFKAYPNILQNSKISTKTMDNRSGIATLLGIMDQLDSLKCEMDVCFVATTQEEVGLRGAIIAAYNVEPDMAIVIDACHGDLPDAPRDETFVLGKGPAIGVGPNLHKNLTKKVMETAKDENIPFQTDCEPEDTGTEAWAVQISRSGIPTVLLSIPVRYMHTPIETVHLGDIKNAAKLVARFVSKAQKEMEGMLCY